MTKNYFKMGLLLTAASFVGVHSSATAGAAAIADFDGGNGTATADSYKGISNSGGWNSAWGNQFTNGGASSNTVINTDPLSGGGNYLSMNLTGSSTTANSTQSVYRSFLTGTGNVITTQPIEFTWDFRLDSDSALRTTASDKIQFIDNNVQSTGSSQTWLITSQGGVNAGHWTFTSGNHDGSSTTTGIDTGVAVVTGTVYHFDVIIHPGASSALTTWDASVTDGLDTFTQAGMSFRSSALTSTGRIQFYSGVDSKGEVLSESLDSFTIANTPEPASLALLCLGGLALKRRRL